MSKKVLFIGDPNHIFNQNLAKSLQNVFPDIEIDFFSTVKNIKDSSKNLYSTIYNPYLFYLNIPMIRVFLSRALYLFQLIRIRKKYDVAHFQYVHYNYSYNSLFIKKLKKKSKFLIANIWGSDLFKKSETQIKNEQKFYNELDFAIVENTGLEKKFKEKFDIPVKIYKFGCAPIDAINNDKRDIDHKANLNLPAEKLNITIGYNNRENQQHVSILSDLYNHSELLSIQNKIHLIIPLTYPKNSDYSNKIKSLLKKSPFTYTIIENFLSMDDLVSLRKASDVIVQLQKTDAMSASMLETIFAGNVVLTGSWLPYEYLKDYHIPLHDIDRVEQVGNKLFELIQNLEEEKNKSLNSRETIYNLISVEKTTEKWKELYSSLFN